MSEFQTGEMIRTALAILTYPAGAREDGILALIADWGPEDYADYIGTTQYIFEELTREAPDVVAQVVERLRRESFEQDS